MNSWVDTQNTRTTSNSERLHYLDWLRVLAIFMVFLFHAVHPFDLGDWQVKNVDQSEVLTIILLILAMWGMPFFFLIAGAGSWFGLQRRTGSQYLRERFYRLLIPFIGGFILFSPIEYYCENMNKLQRGLQTSFQSFLSTFSAFNPLLLHFPGFSPRWMGYGYHLWFLGFLFCFALITLPFFIWLNKKPGLILISQMAKLSEHRGGLLLFTIPIIIVKLTLSPISPLEHDWADFLALMCFFALGFILFADKRFANAIRKDWWIFLTIPTVIIMALLGMYLAGIPVISWYETSGTSQYTLMQLLISIIAVCYSLTMLYVGMRFLDFNNKWLHYGQEAALPFFVLHQPVIIVIAFYVVQWNADILIKLPVVAVSSFVVTTGLYELIVRRINVIRLVFGMKSQILYKA